MAVFVVTLLQTVGEKTGQKTAFEHFYIVKLLLLLFFLLHFIILLLLLLTVVYLVKNEAFVACSSVAPAKVSPRISGRQNEHIVPDYPPNNKLSTKEALKTLNDASGDPSLSGITTSIYANL